MATPTTFAGFTPANIAAYFGVNTIAAQGIIALGNGSPAAALPTDQKAALASLNPARFKPGATTYNQGFGDIVWGLDHLAQHPAGSHYHGDFNITDLVANVATGGLYGVAKAGFNVVTGQQNIVSAVKDSLAVTGPAGSALQPTIGTNKTLILESVVAAPIAGKYLLGSLGVSGVAGAEGVLGLLKDAAGKAFTTFVAGDNTNTTTPGIPGTGSPLLPSGSSTYVSVTGAGTAPSGGGYFDSQGQYVPPATASAGVDPKVVLSLVGLAVLAFVILKRRK